MLLDEKEEHKELIEKTIKYLEGRGYTEIKADIEGYESPKSFKMKSKDQDVTPDIVATHKNGKIQYIEVGVKSGQPNLLKSKWKFLETLAGMKDRVFRVVSHRGSYQFTDKLMKEIDLKRPSLRI
ncbi:MAG: hypothetical protein WDZ35_00535 [Crocinitomicaceae bacterium]